jgi:uncharacterized protein (TIGR02246 family)
MSTELERMNEAWIRAWFEKDAGTVNALMTNDYEYVGPNGRVLDRATILQIIRSPTYSLSSGMRTEVRMLEIAPGVVAVAHRWHGTGTYEGRSFKDDHRCTTLCVRRDGKWLIAHEQCSPIGS